MQLTRFTSVLMSAFISMGSIILSPAVTANTLHLEIDNIKNEDGKLLIQLFNSEKSYKENKAVKMAQVAAKKGQVKVTFNDLEQGEYAIRYFHDENSDNQMETNMFGMPTEGFGYSNNAQPNFGPASYEDMKFQLTEQEQVNKSSVIYIGG